MAKLSKNLLTASIIAATASTMAPAAFAADEAELNVSTRTLYFNRDFREGATDRISLSQALRIDYVSPTFADRVKVGASLFGNLKLDERKAGESTGALRNKNGEGESYGKLGQLYVDVALTENASLRAGRMVLGTPLLNDSDSRATPSSTQAVVLQGSVGGADLYGIYSDRASAKTDSSFDKYPGDITLVGGSYGFDNGLSLNAAYGVAEDYLSQVYLNASYTFDLGNDSSLLIDGYHYAGEAEGSLFGNANYDSTLSNVAARYSVGNLALTASYQTIGDEDYVHTWGGSDDNGLMTWNSVQINDFNRADEDSWQLRADYKFSPSLKGMIRHTSGETDAANSEVAETNVDVTYALQTGVLKGASVRVRYAHVATDAAGGDIDEVRVIANYAF